jgi:Flavin containing amine oxidoreductase
MADWLAQRSFTSPRLRWLVDYSCRDDYGLTVEQTSAWAGLFYFASRVVKPGTEPRPLITWQAGNGRLVEHLVAGLSSQTRLGIAAIEIIPTAAGDRSGVDVVALSPDGHTARGFHAERVIFAAPQFLARHLVRPYRDDPPKHLGAYQYGSWLVANLFLRGRPTERGFPLAWDNVLYESPSLGYVTATHQRGPESGPTVLTYYYPFCDGDPLRARRRLLDLDWRACAELALTDLSLPHPDLRPLVERIDVMRWGHAMVRPSPGFHGDPDRSEAARPFRQIHFANTDLSGVALFEEAFYHGLRAAEEVLQARNRSFDSWLL